MKYSIHTTGCRSNQCDSWVMEEKLRRAGFLRCDPDCADVIIVNACTVTENAEKDLRRYITKMRRINGKAKIVLTGCHAQVYPQKNFGAELVLGQKEKFDIVNHVGMSGIFTAGENGGFSIEVPSDFHLGSRTRFFLKIQDGCDRYCTYCIVPFARGKPRSLPATDVIKIMGELKRKGVREVILSGIEIASYHDDRSGLDLKGLLRVLEESDTPERIRLSSVDPLYIDSEFIDILSSSEKLARSIHIPLQSGSDIILETMGRKYKARYVRDVINELKRKVENMGIGLDVIVGFPGEKESEFMETLKFIESLDIYYLHIFPFSPREKTLAAGMTGMVEDAVKKERVKILKEIDRRKRLNFYERYLTGKLRVLPEKKIFKGGYVKGFSDNYIPVFLPYNDAIVNRFVDAVIVEVKRGEVYGCVPG